MQSAAGGEDDVEDAQPPMGSGQVNVRMVDWTGLQDDPDAARQVALTRASFQYKEVGAVENAVMIGSERAGGQDTVMCPVRVGMYGARADRLELGELITGYMPMSQVLRYWPVPQCMLEQREAGEDPTVSVEVHRMVGRQEVTGTLLVRPGARLLGCVSEGYVADIRRWWFHRGGRH